MTQDQFDGERRLVTVLFADLVGYTSASEARDPELIRETLEICFGRLGDEVRRHGGYVDKVVGDSIMALFGAPRAQEDDAGKAIAAGLAMQRALDELVPEVEARLGSRFHLRVGINTGLVVTGTVGPGAYTVTGDAVNVASRLESNAPHGAVLVGETTRRLARRQFQWGDRLELKVKNRQEPVVCFVAERAGASLMRLVPAPSDTPYVGRLDLLQRLESIWSEEGHAGRVVELVGEAGIGKTRFLAHFFSTQGTTASQVIYARADTPPRTFGPLLQLLPSIAENVADELRTSIERLAESQAGTIEEPELSPDWLVDGLVRVVEVLARDHRIALVLDDMHRADDATIEVVEKLLPRLARLPVLTLLLRQPVGRRRVRYQPVEPVALRVLDDADGADVVRAAAPALDEPTVTTIVSRAGGNPLYLELLAGSASRSGDVSLPQSLQSAVVARVDDLDDVMRGVLREASIFGHSFFEGALKVMSASSADVVDVLPRLCEAGVLEVQQGGGAFRAYAFRHSLVQQVLYEGLLRKQRTALHLRAAEALELVSDDGIEVEPEQIAYHLERAGDAQRAAMYHLASAERAERLRADSQATHHRRAANRLLSLTSLAELYAGSQRASLAGRAGAVAMQIAIALALVAPMFVAFSAQSPPSDAITLGLPLDIVELNASSVLLAVAIGGLPLLLAGIVFSHIAAPVLMKRRVSVRRIALTVGLGWVLALGFVLLGLGMMMAMLRFGALDRLSSIYVGASTLQILLGDYSLVWTAVVGTGITAAIWTVLLRRQAAGWSRPRDAPTSTFQHGGSRRVAALGQFGLLVGVAGLAAVVGLVAYRAGLLSGGDDARSGSGVSGAMLAAFGGLALAGVIAWLWARWSLRLTTPAHAQGLLGFEIPLVSALAFGLVVWFGMRQAVIVSANDVDEPGSVAAFDRAVSFFPDFSLAYYLRAERHLASATFDGPETDPDAVAARDDFTKAIELDPSFPASYLARGRVLVGLGDYDAAIADADRLIELLPEHPGGYAIRALAHFEQGDLGKAADDLALAIRPLDEDARGWDSFFIRCLALVAAQRLDDAQADCERVLETNPDHYVSLDQLVTIADEKQEYERGIEHLDRMIAITDGDYRTWSNRGWFKKQLGDYEGSDEDLSRALELNPEDVYSYVQRSQARLHLDRVDDALADANKAAELSERERFARLYIARHIGDWDLAIDDATALIATEADDSPTLPYLYSVRGLARVESGDRAAGMADLDEALRIAPTQPAALDRRAYARFLGADYDGAEADLNQALLGLSMVPSETRADLYFHRALVLESTGRADAARSDIAEALNYVEIPVARRAIEVVSQRLGSP